MKKGTNKKKFFLINSDLFPGLEFLQANSSAATNKDELTPIGFDIVFPMMIQYADDLNLDLPLSQDFVDTMFQNRNAEIKRLLNYIILPLLNLNSELCNNLQKPEFGICC